MRRLKKLLSMFLACLLVFTLLPVNADAGNNIKINKTKLTMYVGSTTTLKITGTSQKTAWSSGSKKVATVNSKGIVTAKKAGKTTITAKVSGKKYKCTVTVKKPYLNLTKKTLDVGKTCILKLTGEKIKSFSSSNTKVAAVSLKGKITAKAVGKATITVKGKSGKTYKCTITVTDNHSHSYVSITTQEATCANKGEWTETCTICGDKKIYEIPKKEEHKWNTGTITVAPTTTSDGQKTYTCTLCGTTKTESIPADTSKIYQFRYASYLQEHFEKHGAEFGYTTTQQYLEGANKVINADKVLHKLEAEDGDDVYYLESTNELVIVSTDGYIRTYFKPTDGIAYYNRQ